MQTCSQDICVLTPDYPDNHIIVPETTDDPCPQAPVLKCPEYDRAQHQAGPWKRHMRECHNIPYMTEDLFQPLRDTINGRAICRHCRKPFIDIYRLRYHINTRNCLHFDGTKDQIVPISARPALRMHLRYKSIPGILLDKPLVAELANHCAFCHLAAPTRSIRKHYGAASRPSRF